MKPIQITPENEGCWLALSRSTHEVLDFDLVLKELSARVDKKYLISEVLFHKHGYYKQIVPRWSRFYLQHKGVITD